MTWEVQARHVDSSPRPLFLPSVIFFFASNVSRQPFFFSPYTLHIHYLCGDAKWTFQLDCNGQLALLWSPLCSEGSIVPDLPAWFACLWIMGRTPQSGLDLSSHFSLWYVWSSKHIGITVIYTYGMDSLSLPRSATATYSTPTKTYCIYLLSHKPPPAVSNWVM